MAFAFRWVAARRKQRADLRTRVQNALASERSSTYVILCLPTAPALPTRDNGDFGTSPIYGQLSDKPSLTLVTTWDAE
jgi:hypothetical protein